MARDKETSPLSSDTLGFGAAYDFPVTWASWLKKRHSQPPPLPHDGGLRVISVTCGASRRAARTLAPNRSTSWTPTSSASTFRSGSEEPAEERSARYFVAPVTERLMARRGTGISATLPLVRTPENVFTAMASTAASKLR